jgi:superoxide dismutase
MAASAIVYLEYTALFFVGSWMKFPPPPLKNVKNVCSLQGSGWGWLGYNKAAGKLQIAACPNQDPLEASLGLVPLFGE